LSEYIKKQGKSKETYKNLMFAYKWLAELYGVLCTDSTNKSNIKSLQNKLEKALTEAINMKHKCIDINDDHLEFLLHKKICNVSI